ncbi:MAG TPA: hypothetical protein PK940_08000, partial [Rectinema sp.]|nr:hypothetical protein [Rectinema sp.]
MIKKKEANEAYGTNKAYDANEACGIKEACGVVAVVSEEAARLAFFGLFALQHRGQESAGIATLDEGNVHLHKDVGLVSQVFRDQNL